MANTDYWKEIEHAFDNIAYEAGYEAFKEGVSRYPDWKIDLLATHWTMSETINGGLVQYFANHSGIFAPEAVIGLQRIGKPELAALLQEAIARFGDPYPRDRDTRRKVLANWTGQQPEALGGFSPIPKWVALKGGITPPPDPFSDLYPPFVLAEDSVWEAMDAYAEKNVSESNPAI